MNTILKQLQTYNMDDNKTVNEVSKKRCQKIISFLQKRLKECEKKEQYELCVVYRDEIETISSYVLGYNTFLEIEPTIISVLTENGNIQEMDWETLTVSMCIPMLDNEVFYIQIPLKDFEKIWKIYSNDK